MTEMKMNLFVPSNTKNAPVLICLSGRLCDQDTIVRKSKVMEFAQHFKIAVVFPDTSPRDLGDEFKDGYGASYYVDAT